MNKLKREDEVIVVADKDKGKRGTITQLVGDDLPTTIEKLEQNSIRNALTKFEGNVTHSANALGLGRTNLIAKMRKYNIKSRTVPSSVDDDAVADHPSLLVDS